MSEAWKELFAGTCGGFAQALTGHPFDTLKVIQQTGENIGVKEAFQKVWASGGVGGLYRGVQSPLLGLGFMNAVLFSSWTATKKALGETEESPLKVAEFFFAGGVVGGVVAAVEGPVDFFKCQLQVRASEYRGFTHCASSILRTFGARAPFQGYTATLARNVPGNACFFGFYEAVREHFTTDICGRDQLAPWQVLLAGSAGGITYWLSTYPIDVIKSTMQSDHPDPAKRVHTSMSRTAKNIYARSGTAGFFRGIAPCMMRSIPANAATFFAYEEARKFVNKKKVQLD